MNDRNGLFARQVSDFIKRYRPALLRLALGPDYKEDAQDARDAKEILGKIRRGEERSYSLEEVWGEIEDLEKRSDLDP